MNVAVVADTQEHATAVIARLGMVLNARALAAGVSPLLGMKFSAVLLVDIPFGSTVDPPWWHDLRSRNDGPTLRLDTT